MLRATLTNEVSVARRIQEALLAIEIERYYTKDEILERYLNIMYFGSGAYGIEAAAHTYFGTDVGRLTLGQSAMLAGLLAAPSDYSPYVNVGHAKERQHHVLGRMVDAHFVSAAQADAAERAPLRLIGGVGLRGGDEVRVDHPPQHVVLPLLRVPHVHVPVSYTHLRAHETGRN